jgi:uncharacterized membrane protein
MTLWLHLMGPALSFGSGAFFIFVFYPAFKSLEDSQARMKVFVQGIKYFHPIYLLGFCVALLSGASQITDLKINLGSNYFDVIAQPLLWKFGLTLLMFMIGGIQSFGFGLPLTKMVNGLIEGSDEQKDSYVNKIWWATLINLILIGVTVFIGLKLSSLLNSV